MGMYTEIIFGAGLKDISETDIKILEYMLDPKLVSDTFDFDIPDHKFFKTERWQSLFIKQSYYFPLVTYCSFFYDQISDLHFLGFRSNLKNYNSEIELFLDWIKPYIEEGSGDSDFYAITCYEQQDIPTIHYLCNLGNQDD